MRCDQHQSQSLECQSDNLSGLVSEMLECKLNRRFESELDQTAICRRLRVVFSSLDIKFVQVAGSFICMIDERSFRLSVESLEPRIFELRVEAVREPIVDAGKADYYFISRLIILLERSSQAVSLLRPWFKKNSNTWLSVGA